MTLTLQLTPDLEMRLAREAGRTGLDPNEYALRLLDTALSSPDKRSELSTLLQEWIDEGDEDEHRETGGHLIEALDHDRLSERSLFPPELKGVTW